MNKINIFQELQKLDGILESNFKQKLSIEESSNIKIFPIELMKLATFTGIYFLCSDKLILYVGKSTQLGARIAGHCTKSATQVPFGMIKQVFYIDVSIQKLDAVERACIYFFQTAYNKISLMDQKTWVTKYKKWIKTHERLLEWVPKDG